MVVAHRPDDCGELRHLGLGQTGRRLVHQDEAAALSRARARHRAAARRRAPALRPADLGLRRRARAARAARRRGAAPPRLGADAECRNLDVLAYRETAKRSGCAGTCARGPRGRAGAGSSGSRRARRARRLPRSGSRSPVMTLTSVDLPAPFGPISPTTSWRCSSIVTPSSACTPSNERETAAARNPPGRRVSAGFVASTNLRAQPMFAGDDAVTRPTRLSTLFWISITRYCRPNTEWYCWPRS